MNSVYSLIVSLAEKFDIDVIGIVDNRALDKYTQNIDIPPKQEIPFFKGSIYDRLDIKNAWKPAKSVISFALSYNSSLKINDLKGDRVQIASSSFGEDYHRVLKKKADFLMKEFVKEYTCHYRIYIDTGKLSDKALAYCSGIGFFGKNGLIINERFGSYIFLGHILLDIDISQAVQTKESKCGSCSVCLQGCPQNAYSQDGKYHFDKCVSYLNQTGKNYNTTTYIFGCDICQKRCPFNKNAPTDLHEEFSSTLNDAFPLKSDIMNMNEEAFRNRYARCSLAWRGLDSLKINCNNIINRSTGGGRNV